MDESNDLRYSDEGCATRYLYYKDYQDINIFIEDQDKEYEYEILFSSLLPNLEFKTLFASGGKPAMKELYNEFGIVDVDNTNHPNIYIVDGDFDRIIFPDKMIVNDHFIYLDAYNIESYLFNEKACVKFAMGHLHLPYDKTKITINYQQWYSSIISQASELFFIYCNLQANHPSVKNIGNGPYIFIDNNTGLERVGALSQYKKKLLDENNIDIDAETEQIVEIKNNYRDIYGNDYWHLICGKFVLTSLMNYLASKRVKPIKENDLRWWLINNIALEPLDYLKHKINNIISKYKKDEL